MNSSIKGMPMVIGAGDIGTKTITENGVYNASADNLDGYSEVTVDVENVGYIRPSGVPNGESIIANAPIIESGGVNYYPIYYIAMMDTFTTKTFAKTGSGVATGADAFVFSDEPTTLYVGNTTHTFDHTKDFVTSESWKARYVIMYATEANKDNVNGITVNIYNYKETFEFIGGSNFILSSDSALSGTTIPASNNFSLKYINLKNSSIENNTISASYFLYGAMIEELLLPDSLTTITGNTVMHNLSSLSKFEANGITSINSSQFLSVNGLRVLNLPSLTEILQYGLANSSTKLKYINVPNLVTTSNFAYNCYNLSYIDLSNLTTYNGATNAINFNYTKFIKLPINFNPTDLTNFTGATGYLKSYNWLNSELPTKLIDLTGETAKTLTLGAGNIALMTAETLAIISGKNWTLA